MQSDVTVTIPDGNAVELTVAWADMDGAPEAPTAVRYQVFDARTGVSVGDIVTVPTPAASMTFTVPGADLPGNTTGLRKLVIQLEGTFTAGDVHIEHVAVSVLRAYTYAELE